MICCLIGAFLLSQLLVVWREVGAILRSLSIALAVCGVALLGIGIMEWQITPEKSLLVPLCSDGRAGGLIALSVQPGRQAGMFGAMPL